MSSYKTIECMQMQDSYSGGQTVNWEITMPGLQLDPDNIYFSGELSTNNNYANNTCSLDNTIGAHAIFDNFIVSFDKGQKLVDSNVPRYLKHYRVSNWDTSTPALRGTELISPDGNFQQFDVSANYPNGQSFLIKPQFSLNRSKAPLTYTKFGNIRIQVYLRPANKVFYTTNQGADFNYTIKTLRLHYRVSPDSLSVAPVRFESFHSSAPAITSSRQIIQTMVGSNLQVRAVSASFLSSANQSNTAVNKHQLDAPGLTSVEFSFNDEANGFMSYALKKPSDIEYNGIQALNKNYMKRVSLDAQTLTTSGVQLFGVSLPNYISLLKNKMSITIEIPNLGGNSFICYQFLDGIIEL